MSGTVSRAAPVSQHPLPPGKKRYLKQFPLLKGVKIDVGK